MDNFVAGIGLGVFRFPVLLSAAVLGLCSALASLVALHLGAVLGRCLGLRTEAIGGGALLLVALSSLLSR